MYSTAEDEAERRRIEAKLYAPPKELRRPRRRQSQSSQSSEPTARGGLSMQYAQALMAQFAAQDAQLGTG
jgi:hypothetical protein